MTARGRNAVFVVAAVVFAAGMLWAMRGLPPFGTFTGPYTELLIRVTTAQRHVYNVPTAINFDYRGLDTLGEEFIFFTSITGLLFLFKGLAPTAREVAEEPGEGPGQPPDTKGVLWLGAGIAPIVAALGMDVAAHGQTTPGGGFQGGAIFGSTVAAFYAGLGLVAFRRYARKEWFERMEAAGALAFAIVGLATLASAGIFLANVLPLGKPSDLVSGGTIYLLSCLVFVEIGAGVALMMALFLEQLHRPRDESS